MNHKETGHRVSERKRLAHAWGMHDLRDVGPSEEGSRGHGGGCEGPSPRLKAEEMLSLYTKLALLHSPLFTSRFFGVREKKEHKSCQEEKQKEQEPPEPSPGLTLLVQGPEVSSSGNSVGLFFGYGPVMVFFSFPSPFSFPYVSSSFSGIAIFTINGRGDVGCAGGRKIVKTSHPSFRQIPLFH